MFKSGYIAIIGRPNVGKSTLLNALLGQKIAAVTAKPQTTRHRILGIKNLPGAQFLFLDTPGIHQTRGRYRSPPGPPSDDRGPIASSGGRPSSARYLSKALNEYMMDVAHATLNDADVFLFLIEPADYIHREDREIFQTIAAKRKPILLVITKIDRGDMKKTLPFIAECRRELVSDEIVPVASLQGKGLKELEEEIVKRLPEGPAYYPEDQVTDQTERFLATEIIREKIMELTREEIPYSIAVLIEAFEEPKEAAEKKVTRIRAAIIAEKDSQKGILIGKGGSMLKNIGTRARKDLEEQLGTQVYLELFVRVEKEWTKDPKKVKEFAYEG